MWLRKCGQIFRLCRILCPDLSAVVQDDEGGRDYRTEPGALTPGTDIKDVRPESGGREVSALECRTRSSTDFLPPLQHPQPATRVQFQAGASNRVDTPFLQTTTFEHEHEHEHERLVRAGTFLNRYLGLKPQAESYCPFGAEPECSGAS